MTRQGQRGEARGGARVKRARGESELDAEDHADGLRGLQREAGVRRRGALDVGRPEPAEGQEDAVLREGVEAGRGARVEAVGAAVVRLVLERRVDLEAE